MRPRIQKLIGTIGTLCLAGTLILRWNGVSLILFGEVPFPEE